MNGVTETLDPALARHLLRELGEEAREPIRKEKGKPGIHVW